MEEALLRDSRREIDRLNLARLRLAAYFVAVLELVLAALDVVLLHSVLLGALAEWGVTAPGNPDLLLTGLRVTLVLLSVLYLGATRDLPPPERVARRHLVAGWLYVCLGLVAVALTSALSRPLRAGVDPFVVAILGVATVAYLPTLQCVVLLPLAWLAQLGMFARLGRQWGGVYDDIMVRDLAGSLLITVVAMAVSRLLYANRLREFEQVSIIEQQRVALEEANRELLAHNRSLESMARCDALTGVPNRRAFEEHVEHEWLRAARDQSVLTVLVIDIDRFEAYNDRYGRQAGDDCLARVAREVGNCVHRPGDLIARVGGEEFAAVLADTDCDGARTVSRRILTAVRRLEIEHADAPGGVLTVSVGAATRESLRQASWRDLFEEADAAMHAAKRLGGDRWSPSERDGRAR